MILFNSTIRLSLGVVGALGALCACNPGPIPETTGPGASSTSSAPKAQAAFEHSIVLFESSTDGVPVIPRNVAILALTVDTKETHASPFVPTPYGLKAGQSADGKTYEFHLINDLDAHIASDESDVCSSTRRADVEVAVQKGYIRNEAVNLAGVRLEFLHRTSGVGPIDGLCFGTHVPGGGWRWNYSVLPISRVTKFQYGAAEGTAHLDLKTDARGVDAVAFLFSNRSASLVLRRLSYVVSNIE